MNCTWNRSRLPASKRDSYAGFIAVDTLNLAVRQSEIYGLLGPNGAGKSTTIKMLVGLLCWKLPTPGALLALATLDALLMVVGDWIGRDQVARLLR